MTFDELSLRPETMSAVKELGFEDPTPIQREGIPLLAQGVDLIGQAQTGSGKTAAFGIHIIEKIDTQKKIPQALILTPTRELAVQVATELKKLGKYYHLSVAIVYGGASMNVQADELQRGAQIVVGTPGRIIDMLERRILHLDKVHTVVLDEADRMLDMGFIDDVKLILERTPKTRQTMLFSATMPDEIRKLAQRYMNDPESLTVSTDAVPIDKIRQTHVFVDGRNKFRVLLSLLKKENPKLALIFVKTKIGADKIARQLHHEGNKVIALHGNLSQSQRDRAMLAFRQGHVSILVATDIAARGIDVTGITHIINYDIPMDPNIYSHRVGRTARAGASGKAISFVTPEQNREFRDIQLIAGVRIPQERVQGDLDEERGGRIGSGRIGSGGGSFGHRYESAGSGFGGGRERGHYPTHASGERERGHYVPDQGPAESEPKEHQRHETQTNAPTHAQTHTHYTKKKEGTERHPERRYEPERSHGYERHRHKGGSYSGRHQGSQHNYKPHDKPKR